MRHARQLFAATLVFAALTLCAPRASTAQLLADTVFTWQSYGTTGTTHLRLYKSTDERREHVVVLTELAENRGAPITEDVQYLAEEIGTALGIDPAAAFWVYRVGAYSYDAEADDTGDEILLRATFGRTKTERLSSPTWRVVTPRDLGELTDRQFIVAIR
jgi:hypothetical protein